MKMLGIAIAVFFAGLVLWVLAANATPLGSAANKQLWRQSNQLADQHCTKSCYWAYSRESTSPVQVCDTDCWNDKLQEHDQQLVQNNETDGTYETDKTYETVKRKRERWLKWSTAQRRRCWTECHTDGQTGGCVQRCDQ
jgi:hypothetical protein